MNRPSSFWGTPAGIAIRWIAFFPLFLGMWVLGLIGCLAALDLPLYLRIPFLLMAATWAMSVIGLPAIITPKPKAVAAVLLTVFIIGSIFIFSELLTKSSSVWEILTITIFSLLAVIVGFGMLNIDKP